MTETSMTLLAQAIDAALEEILDAILAERASGRTPDRHSQPDYSLRANGMPSLSDSLFSRAGPEDQASLLRPRYDADEETRKAGNYPAGRFPAFTALKTLAVREAKSIMAFRGIPEPLLDIHAQLMIEKMTDAHVARWGETPSSPASRAQVIRPWLAPLHRSSLPIALVTPIALVNFGVDRFRIDPRAFLIRMSPALQRARWSSKAYGANGHDSVLAAATHAFVLTGWQVKQAEGLEISNVLSSRVDEAREAIERLFAAFRLITGLETGYAQEVRLARGWRLHQRHDLPEIYASGARRYLEGFDDFGWTRDPLPSVGRDQLKEVADAYRSMTRIDDTRFDLALRRFNAAMIRHDPADGLLDATIALEILLGDKNAEAVSWKLRMRAAALIGFREPSEAVQEVLNAVKSTYEARSRVVHGNSARGKAVDAIRARGKAVDMLRRILLALARDPHLLDSQKLDGLMLGLAADAPLDSQRHRIAHHPIS